MATVSGTSVESSDEAALSASGRPQDDPANVERPRRATVVSLRAWVLSTVVLATVLQMAPRLWGAAGGWFLADDFWRQDWVTRDSPWHIATLAQGGHLQPLSVWMSYTYASWTPFNWTAQVWAIAVLWIVADLLVLAAFRAIWGWGWPTAVAYSLFALSSLTTVSFLWVSQVWLGAPGVIALGLLLLTTVNAVRRPTIWRHLVAWIALLVALGLSERSAVEAVCVGAFLVVAFSRDQGGVLRFAVRNWRLYVGSFVVLSAYAVVYLQAASSASGDALLDVRPSAAGLLPNMAEGLGQSVAPGLLGGPWFLDATPVVAHAEMSSLAVLLVLEALLGIAIAVLVVRRRGLAPLLLLVIVVALALGLIAVARGGPGGLIAMRDYRYFASLAVWWPLLLVLALVDPGDPVRGAWPARFPEQVRRTCSLHPVVWAVVALVAANGALLTTYLAADRFRQSTSKAYLERSLADLATLGPVVIVDRPLPDAVVPGILTTQAFASRVLSAASPRPSFDQITSHLYALTNDGAVVPADAVGGTISPPGPDGVCGYAVKPGSTARVPLNDGLFAWTWWARIDYLAQSDTTLTVTMGDQVISVPVAMGPHTVFVPYVGAVRSVRIAAPESGGGVCVAGIHVGLGAPAPH